MSNFVPSLQRRTTNNNITIATIFPQYLSLRILRMWYRNVSWASIRLWNRLTV